MTIDTVQVGGNARTAPASSTSSNDVAEFQEVFGIAPAFRGLGKEHVEALLSSARIERFTAGHVIGKEGEPSQSLYLLVSGEVSVFLGQELREVSAMLSRGSVFGGNVILGEPNWFSFGAERDTLVASWTEAQLRRAESTAPGLLNQLTVRLSKDNRLTELSDILQHAPLLRNTSAVLRHRLLNETTLMQFPAGARIFEEGQPASCCYLVVNGEVELTQKSGASQAATVLLGRGALFGEADIFATGSRSQTAEAKMEQTEVLAIDRIDILALQRACGSFRRAFAEHVRADKPTSRPQDIILLVNRTGYSTKDLAAITRSALAAVDEKRVAVLEAMPEQGGGAASEGRLEIPREPERAIEALDARARQIDARYVLLFTTLNNSLEWLAEPAWDKIIDHRVSACVYFTDDMKRAFPIETPQLSPVQYVEVRSATSKTQVHTMRSGSIRLQVDALPGAELKYEAITSTGRAALQRLARTLTRQSVGVALGGGAAWGYAHAALLRGLVDAGIPIDMVSGTSMGSVLACAFGSRGITGVEELVEAGPEFALRFATAPLTRRPLLGLVNRILAHQNLEDMPLPVFPVALDVQTGRARTFRHGPVWLAGCASSAVPVAVVPELLDGVRYVDGGMVNNVPVSCLVEEGADFIIASNVIPAPKRLAREEHSTEFTRFLSRLSPFSRFQDTIRAMYLMMRDAGTRQAAAAHVTFAPASVGKFNLLDFAAAKKMVEATSAEVPRFVELTKAKYKAFCASRDY